MKAFSLTHITGIMSSNTPVFKSINVAIVSIVMSSLSVLDGATSNPLSNFHFMSSDLLQCFVCKLLIWDYIIWD